MRFVALRVVWTILCGGALAEEPFVHVQNMCTRAATVKKRDLCKINPPFVKHFRVNFVNFCF